MKKTFAAVFAAFGLIVFANTGHAEFPNRDITIIVHASPGGGFDAIARALGRYMKPLLPKNIDVIVKNVVGAGGITGTVAMYRAKPDGHTIGHIYADGDAGDPDGPEQRRLRHRQVYLARGGELAGGGGVAGSS